jgi:hypothetical protein
MSSGRTTVVLNTLLTAVKAFVINYDLPYRLEAQTMLRSNRTYRELMYTLVSGLKGRQRHIPRPFELALTTLVPLALGV